MKRDAHRRFHHFVLVAGFALANATVASAAATPNVSICHFPPANPSRAQLLTVGAAALPGHLAHNDAVCPAGSSDCCFQSGDDEQGGDNASLCTNFQTDPNNCGSCGNACAAGTTCSAGSCVATCDPGSTLCSGTCVDPSSDSENCGSCGNACAAGTTCSAGSCVATCPTGTTSCGGVCVNQNTDAENCGSCGTVCAMGNTCTGGSCQSTCPPGETPCGAACVNQNTDPNNCGSCGLVCVTGTTCAAGTCTQTEIAASCLPTSSLSVLIEGTAVTAYVPLGSWSEPATGVAVVPIEPAAGAATLVDTAGPVNSCSSNGLTGLTVCTGNTNDVYVINGTTLMATLTANGTGEQNFSGGLCTTCGVATDTNTGSAWLAEGTSSGTGQLESLNPVTGEFGLPIDLFGELTSEDISIDPVRHLILSATEAGNFQIIDSASGAVFNSTTNFALTLNATAEDCSTGIAAAPGEFSSSIVLTDLSQATYTPGAPGTWSAPSTVQDFPDFLSFTAAGVSGMAIAPGSHLAGVTDEFGGPAFGVVQLPAVGGIGAPVALDYVAASMPNDPSGAAWDMGLDPHTVTAYTSPNTGTATLAISNLARTYLALVDMQALLAAPRTPGTNTVDPTFDLTALPNPIVRFVAE